MRLPNIYYFTMNTDEGLFYISTMASNYKIAINIILNEENAPLRAIKQILKGNKPYQVEIKGRLRK